MVILRVVKGLSLPDVRGDQAETMLRQNLWRERRHQDQMPGILGRRRGGVGREGRGPTGGAGSVGGADTWPQVGAGEPWCLGPALGHFLAGLS